MRDEPPAYKFTHSWLPNPSHSEKIQEIYNNLTRSYLGSFRTAQFSFMG